MAEVDAANVREELKEELYKLLISSIETRIPGQVENLLVDRIVEQLQPRLQQKAQISLDDATRDRLAEAIAMKLGPDEQNGSGGGGAMPLLGQAGFLVASLLAAFGIVALIAAAFVLLRPAETRSVATEDIPPVVTEPAANDTGNPAWRQFVSRLALERSEFFKNHSALICGADTLLLDCRPYSASIEAWKQLSGDSEVAQLKQVAVALADQTGCATSFDDATAYQRNFYIEGIDRCLADAGTGQ
ncbi:PIN domain-containing protein [Stakelama tenebrarum]|uniref:Uncharacterized protein n=1 Tax=Stakelama tenebrarum TaxID=2711215 RepID=A0A6G6Y822_9SPHN|nr:hypothetical protein [Sphingosinithalassobacter tenebrarum]QIG81075.1 hypothetical protein G5C33_15650 [Sphingosinithalassobacter tenebrarum]